MPKTLVYELARYRNCEAVYDLVPESVMTKEPSAELKPDQRDVDSLPPYEQLDPILQAYVEDDRSLEEIVGLGHDPTYAELAIELVDRSEHKRRQAPPGVKVTRRAFGRDRRLPIHEPLPRRMSSRVPSRAGLNLTPSSRQDLRSPPAGMSTTIASPVYGSKSRRERYRNTPENPLVVAATLVNLTIKYPVMDKSYEALHRLGCA